MTQITINIENQAVVPSLKKLLGFLDGVSIAKPARKAKVTAESKAAKLDKICGAWNISGNTSDEDIAMIYGSRQLRYSDWSNCAGKQTCLSDGKHQAS